MSHQAHTRRSTEARIVPRTVGQLMVISYSSAMASSSFFASGNDCCSSAGSAS